MPFVKTPARGGYIQVKINGNYVNIPGVEGISEFGAEKSFYENTAIDDTAKTFNADLPDPGELTLAGSWDSKDTAHAHLQDSADNVDAKDDFKVVYNSGATAEMTDSKVLSFKVSAIGGQDEKFSCRVKLSGAVNFVAAT